MGIMVISVMTADARLAIKEQDSKEELYVQRLQTRTGKVESD